MPNMDGTGPDGRGPMTGRGAGKCAPQSRRSGRGQGAYVSLSKEEQKKILQEEKKDIESMLKELE